VRRALPHRRAILGRRVAAADDDADLREGRIDRADLLERTREVLLHVVRERLERRDVEDVRLVEKCVTLPQERIDRPQERRERLSGPRRRGDEDVRARTDQRPAALLRRGRLAEALGEPASDRGDEHGERHRGMR